MNTTNITSLEWLALPAKALSEDHHTQALQRQDQLTKPVGALGKLEAIAVQMAAMQATDQPQAERVHITVFAADHGVTAEGVSAFPQIVTTEMVKNFARGGAAINVAARFLGASLDVCNLGTITPTEHLNGVTYQPIAAQTANFVDQPAMTHEQLATALAAGRTRIQTLKPNTDLFIGGEMGIGNTTSASALLAYLLDISSADATGPGTGLNADGVNHKAGVIDKALQLHRPYLETPLEALRRLGGFEIAALCGAYIACAQEGVPCLVDGFIASVAALVACRINPDVEGWLILSHYSAEPAYGKLLSAFYQQPLLALGMRLGEGSGAAAAVPLIRLACQLHNQMATFVEAAVSESE